MTCAAPVPRSQGTPDSVEKCGKAQVPFPRVLLPMFGRPSLRSGTGLLGQVAFDLNWLAFRSICRTPRAVLIGEEACPLPLNRPTPQGSQHWWVT